MKKFDYSYLDYYLFNEWYDFKSIYGYIYIIILPDLSFYIGQKKGKPIKDNYFGTGKYIKEWFEKNVGFQSRNCPYQIAEDMGIIKIILDYALDIKELNFLERLYIAKAKANDFEELCLNQRPGGGGSEFKNRNGKFIMTPETIAKSNRTKKLKIEMGIPTITDETRRKRSEGIKKSFEHREIWNKGLTKKTDIRIQKASETKKANKKNCSAECREKLSKATKGTCWWNNGTIQVRSKECPEGFVRGMLNWKTDKQIVFSEEHKKHLSDSRKKYFQQKKGENSSGE